jgi:hypothetical protein
MSFKEDYLYGKGKEDEILLKIKDYFNKDIEHIENVYSKYDYKDNNYFYELKSRKNKKDDYPTTLIGKDKIINDNVILLFNFIDGLYYINYKENKELFKTFETKLFKRYRKGFNDIEKLYVYIPINHLKKIE